MDITPLTPKGRQIINRYGNGGFTINEIHYTGNILVLSEQVLPWPIAKWDEVTPDSFQALMSQNPLPEIVLIGAGTQFLPLPQVLQRYFRERHIAADIMDTGAACRTYNVLASEDRRVAAALIAV